MKLVTNNLNRKKINSVIKTIEKYCEDANETFYMEGFVQIDKEDPTYVRVNITLNTNELDIPRKFRSALERNGVYLSYRSSNGNEPLDDNRPVAAQLAAVVGANGRARVRVVDPHLPPIAPENIAGRNVWEPLPNPAPLLYANNNING